MSEHTAPLLEISNLRVSIGDKEILKGLNLTVNKGEIHAIMGPNGSGKSTTAYALTGHPSYEVTGGSIFYKGADISEMSPDERAKAGIFLAFQYPTAIPGVSVMNFLRTSLKSIRGQDIPAKQFRQELRDQFKELQMDDSFATRYVNDGFSGGEKKRFEAMQMALMRPELAILDETDSGLDIDALRVVAENINGQAGDHNGILLITHYQRLLNYITPDFVHVLIEGRIVRSGGKELALELEERGYDWLVQEANSLETTNV